MNYCEHHLTLEELLADPLTHAVMRSDNITALDVVESFAQAASGHQWRQAFVPRWTPPQYAAC